MKCDELRAPIKIEIPGIGTIESAELYLKDGRHRATHINPEVRKLMEAGMSKRTAYRHIAATKPKNKEPDFNYDKETPKGEWV